MALSASTVLEVRTAGSDTNGGGFVTGAAGTDYSQQNAKNTVGNNISTTDAVTAGSTTITSATASFTAAIVGNIIYIQGGTASIVAGWYQVTARNSATSITVDRSTGLTTGTGATMNIGGALASPGQAAAVAISTGGISVWQKSGTYSITSASTNVAGGCVNWTVAGSTATTWGNWRGYGSARGDEGTAPIFSASGISTFTLFTAAASNTLDNVTLNGNSLTASTGLSVSSGTRNKVMRVLVENTTTNGIVTSGSTITYFFKCAVTGASGTSAWSLGGTGATLLDCEAYSNTVSGFVNTSAATYINCISYNNTGSASVHGFNIGSNTSGAAVNCTSYGNAGDGFILDSTSNSLVLNCLSEGNTKWGYTPSAKTNAGDLVTNGAYNNTSGNFDTTNLLNTNNNITATSTFFVNAGSGNLALNSTGTGGTLARAAGYPGTFPDTTTIGHLDLGAVQHADPAATGGGGFFIQ